MTSGALEVREFRMNTTDIIITMKKNHLFELGRAPDMSRNDYKEELFVLDCVRNTAPNPKDPEALLAISKSIGGDRPG